ncbi:exopolyphosphatase [Marinobacter sp. X15-166B]|uniref:Ppx/GppA phosphatase family protein n=1 Tax=Marinobacter sp. X15-166B TaxID=1897620 RepID=UPI000A4B5DDB|nr:exopolyphosphatase [Marinobacter sp. X15-166B]
MPEATTATQPGLLAAIDLGSNSFHMVVAQLDHGEIRTLERMGEKVQLGAGIDSDCRLTDEVQERALACLGRFAQRLKCMPRETVQVVGTNALRVARNAEQFMDRAEEALGFPVAVISGREEARLIYLGVSHTLSDDQGRRLVMDIGGGSSELIIGERFEAHALDSLHMGCVSFRNLYFADGRITRRQMDRAITHAAQELLHIRERFLALGWSSAVGSSGSVKAIVNALTNLRITDGVITMKAMKELRTRLIDMGHTDRLADIGVREDRQSIFPAGFAILMAAFESLNIDEMTYADGALREGLLYDMLGRIQHEDVRERTIQALQERYHVDIPQSRAVENTAIAIWGQVAADWGLAAGDDEDLLRWACRLHEIGLTIASSQYHKHGAYLLQYSDLPGFSQQLQYDLAKLVRVHRRKFVASVFDDSDPAETRRLKRLCIILRLGVLLQHARRQEPPPEMQICVANCAMTIQFPQGWFAAHPLTLADLKDERNYLSRDDFTLTVAD